MLKQYGNQLTAIPWSLEDPDEQLHVRGDGHVTSPYAFTLLRLPW